MNELLSDLGPMQRNGLLLLTVSLPLCMWTLWNWKLSLDSKTWPKVEGEIIEVPVVRRSYLISYYYELRGIRYQGHRLFFTNSLEWERRAKTIRNKYHAGQRVMVYYNPHNPKQTVLQPGRRDGLLTSLLFLGVFLFCGAIMVYAPALALEYISKIF